MDGRHAFAPTTLGLTREILRLYPEVCICHGKPQASYVCCHSYNEYFIYQQLASVCPSCINKSRIKGRYIQRNINSAKKKKRTIFHDGDREDFANYLCCCGVCARYGCNCYVILARNLVAISICDTNVKGSASSSIFAGVVSWLAFVVVLFTGHENGDKKRKTKRRHCWMKQTL